MKFEDMGGKRLESRIAHYEDYRSRKAKNNGRPIENEFTSSIACEDGRVVAGNPTEIRTGK